MKYILKTISLTDKIMLIKNFKNKSFKLLILESLWNWLISREIVLMMTTTFNVDWNNLNIFNWITN